MYGGFQTVKINCVGSVSDPRLIESGRGVFNFESVIDFLTHQIKPNIDEIIIDLTKVGWISLFDWWTLTCILYDKLEKNPTLKISLDFLGDNNSNGLLPYKECNHYLNGQLANPEYNRAEYLNSWVVHRVLNFIRALEGPHGFANAARGQLALRYISSKYANKPGWYRQAPEIENSVILPRIRVAGKDMCILFASRQQINLWRESMTAKRVPTAAVFQSEEFWRVLCHELSRNIFEHSGTTGFITARIVQSTKGDIPFWCNEVFDKGVLEGLQSTLRSGFLELCVCDSGVGIPASIEDSYLNRYKERHPHTPMLSPPLDADLLSFAFDELGTCKDKDANHSWITDRHALGHMLFVVGKYGGAITIRSRKACITYFSSDGTFQRSITQLGYKPQQSMTLEHSVPGTHIQMLIPLTPLSTGSIGTRTFTHGRHSPPSFYIDDKHPVGPLVPIHDKLCTTLSICVDGDDLAKFKNACRTLASSILKGSHPREELIVFDFSEIEWSPAQFETFLYLMQNVLVKRPVLFTQFPTALAELVNSQEDEDSPTYLPDVMRPEIKQGALDREFTEGLFLETYSGLGSVVMGIDPDGKRYLFGVRDKNLRQALLLLIDEAQLVQELSKSSGINQATVQTVLNGANFLFKADDKGLWSSVWTNEELELQRSRSTTAHFNELAKRCDAWRGSNAHAKSAKQIERFYLPTEDAIYMEFFESSRILSRERYVTEIAERLIYRLCYGLTETGVRLEDINVLACSTTPSVMLAAAIARVWPGSADKKPVVIDYGPSLFYGADPANIPVTDGSKLRAVVVHDLFDEGKLSAQLIKLAKNQGIDVFCVLSFIRFLGQKEMHGQECFSFQAETGWGQHPTLEIPVHALIGQRRPKKIQRSKLENWGVGDSNSDYVVDPRSLRPVPLRSLRLKSGYSAGRALEMRDRCLKELDIEDKVCRLAAGHFVYGKRHFAIVVDVHGMLTGRIGHEITNWMADLCCDNQARLVIWETDRGKKLHGEVSSLLLPLHSQIHYLLPALQLELAQRGRRVPHYLLDATSFGGGVETYDVPYQLQDQIHKAAEAIKLATDNTPPENEKEIIKKQLRLLIIDDAIFSGQTLQTVLESIAKHVLAVKRNTYGSSNKYIEPIQWIRSFTVLNQLPAAKSALWNNLNSCSASTMFHFDAYAPFIGVASYTSKDCPACRELDHLKNIEFRVEEAGATHALNWIKTRMKSLEPQTTEAPAIREKPSLQLPEPIAVLSPVTHGHYNPYHADSAIWRFYELMYLSYPLGDVLQCLPVTRQAGIKYPDHRGEYARFRLAVYEWCIQNWHQVRLYHAEEQLLKELKLEVEESESIFIEAIYRLNYILPDELVSKFVKWAIDFLANAERDSTRSVSENSLNLDIALTLLFFSLRRVEPDYKELLTYMREIQDSIERRSSFLRILYLRLTRPIYVADPRWALTTIDEICFRGSMGTTAEDRLQTDHDLLGKLVEKTCRNPQNKELRRRLEGSLHAFITASENLQPYFDVDLLSIIVEPAKNVLKWLTLPIETASNDTNALHILNRHISDKASWAMFTDACHMPVTTFREILNKRLKDLKEEAMDNNPYEQAQMTVKISPEVSEWCLMTHIQRLIACLSNIALEPLRKTKATQSPCVWIKPSGTDRPQWLTIHVTTFYGSAVSALKFIRDSPKIMYDFEDIKRFGVEVQLPDNDIDNVSDKLCIIFEIPVGFKPK